MTKEQHEWYWKGYNDAKKSLAQPAVAEQHKQSTPCGEPVAWEKCQACGAFASLTPPPVPEAHKRPSRSDIKPLVIDSQEKASEFIEKTLWDVIDMAAMWPKAKPDPRTWDHLMVYAPQRKPLTDEQIRKLWAQHAAKQNGWPNDTTPPMLDIGNGPRFQAHWHESEYQVFKAGFEAAHGIMSDTDGKE